ncbi:MAG: FAD-dependent monooxygenase [Pseudomonadota bacterium]
MDEIDILVAGGGIAGLAAGARLAADGHAVLVADPKPAAGGGGDVPADRRTTAFLTPALETFRHAGARAAMDPHATPLWAMRIVSAEGGSGTAAGPGPAARAEASFQAREIGERPFGYNLSNMAARAALETALVASPRGALANGVAVERVLARRHDTVARLSDGRQVRARLVVAADGRDSRLRDGAGIAVRRWSYGQHAIVTTVTHEAPHGGVSTEIHRPGGPLVLVPLGDIDGRPASSVVWLNRSARAAALAAMDDTDLAAALTAESIGVMGPLTLAGPRAVWPIVSQLAARMSADRLALVGEPAHVVPPTGAQGANLSVADAECLAGLVNAARTRGEDIGGRALLARYHARRWPAVAARVGGIDALNRLVDTSAAPLAALRTLGTRAAGSLPPLRRALMQAGLGAG